MRWCGGRDVTMWTRVSPDRILISAALIVQNEEKHIGRLLESLVGLADQVVAIDGGSTDRTVEILLSYGVKVIHIPFSGNFADMRNQAIDACSGDFVLMVDGDDEIVDTDFEETRRMLASGDVTPVLMVRYHVTWPKGEEIIMTVPRLFRRDAGCRCIHANRPVVGR